MKLPASPIFIGVLFNSILATIACAQTTPVPETNKLERFKYVQPKMGTVFHLLIWGLPMQGYYNPNVREA